MLLTELFQNVPLFENSATVQVVVNHIRDVVPDVQAIWLYRENIRAPWLFTAVVHDQTEHAGFLAAKENVQRVERGMQGVRIKIDVVNESAFQPQDGAIKVFAKSPDMLAA